MKEPPAASHLAREAHPVTASTPWAVQCGCADYVANIVAIETTSPEEACVRTIEEANASDGWKRLDDSGLTFVHALAPGDVNNPWSRETYGSVLPVPEQYTENGKERVPAHGCVAFVERAACHPRRTDRGEKGELYWLDSRRPPEPARRPDREGEGDPAQEQAAVGARRGQTMRFKRWPRVRALVPLHGAFDGLASGGFPAGSGTCP
jgi:hypothetical protein